VPSYKIAQWKPSTKEKIVQCRRPSRQGQTINTETAIAKGKGIILLTIARPGTYCHWKIKRIAQDIKTD